MKNIRIFHLKIFIGLVVKFSVYLNRHVFIMGIKRVVCMLSQQDKIIRRKRLSTGAYFVHVYIEIWDKGILKFNTFSMYI